MVVATITVGIAVVRIPFSRRIIRDQPAVIIVAKTGWMVMPRLHNIVSNVKQAMTIGQFLHSIIIILKNIITPTIDFHDFGCN